MPAWEYRIVSIDAVGMMNTTIWDTGVREGYTQFRFSEKSVAAHHDFISNYLSQLWNEGWAEDCMEEMNAKGESLR
jgi:hypothetical protein